MAKTAATQALGHRLPVIRSRTKNNNTDDAACNSTLVREVAGRIHAVELAVQHVGEGPQRIPLTGRPIGQRPPEPGERQSGRHMRIFEHELAIVKSDEFVARPFGQRRGQRPAGETRRRPRRDRPCHAASAGCDEFRTGRRDRDAAVVDGYSRNRQGRFATAGVGQDLLIERAVHRTPRFAR